MSKVQAIKDLIADTGWTDKQIAKKMKCSIAYVNIIRNGKRDKGARKIKAATDVGAVLNERGTRYGDYQMQSFLAQQFKRTYRLHLTCYNKFMTPDQEEALEMICTKLARIVNGDPDYADNWVDIAGYAKLVADKLESRAR